MFWLIIRQLSKKVSNSELCTKRNKWIRALSCLKTVHILPSGAITAMPSYLHFIMRQVTSVISLNPNCCSNNCSRLCRVRNGLPTGGNCYIIFCDSRSNCICFRRFLGGHWRSDARRRSVMSGLRKFTESNGLVHSKCFGDINFYVEDNLKLINQPTICYGLSFHWFL